MIGRRIERKPLALVWADAPADHHLAAVDLYRRPREREVRHEEHASLVRAAIDHLMCAWLPAGEVDAVAGPQLALSFRPPQRWSPGDHHQQLIVAQLVVIREVAWPGGSA